VQVPSGSELAYASGVVAVAGGDHVEALHATSGASMWTLALKGVAGITPADGALYADAAGGSSTAGTIDALNLPTGKVTWSAKPPSPQGAGPIAIDGDRLFRTDGTQTQAFNRTNGALIWHVSSSGASGTAETPTLWGTRIFRSPFTAGSGLPGTTLDGPPLSDGDGSSVSGLGGEIASDDVGLQQTSQGLVAYNLSSGTLLWSAFVTPLAALNDQAVTWGKNEIELRSLATGALTWGAQLAGTTGHVVTAVGNGELLVGAGGNLTALVSYPASELPKATLKLVRAFATYGAGAPAQITGRLSQPGIEQAYAFAVAGQPAGSKQFGKEHTERTHADGTLTLAEHPKLDTVYRVSLPDSTVALSLFEVVALPRVGYHFGTPDGARGTVKITVAVPDNIHLAHHRVSLYIGRAASKRYERLGSGRLSGQDGRFAASLHFKLEKHVGKKDFVSACLAGLYRQGMSFGDRLDRHCGAATIRF
jgi:outer membrane protein assembly factor BamB